MTVWLLTSGKDHPLWRPWVQALPRQDGSPIFWTEDELAPLKGTRVLDDVERRRAYQHSAFEEINRVLAALNVTLDSLDEFMWLCSSVTARVFGMIMAGDAAANDVVVPYADLVNHMPLLHKNYGVGYDEETKQVTASTLRPIAKGEELVYWYGEDSNSDLLTQYGFALEQGNEHYANANFVFKVADCPVHCQPLTAHTASAESEECLARLRSAAADVDCSGGKAHPLTPLQIEVRTLEAIAEECAAALHAMGPATAADDEQLLRDDATVGGSGRALTRHERSAVLVRLGEKRVVQVWADLAREALIAVYQVDEGQHFSAMELYRVVVPVAGVYKYLHSVEERLAAAAAAQPVAHTEL
jgi:SET domain/Rubisco LSMT substrate-binding